MLLPEWEKIVEVLFKNIEPAAVVVCELQRFRCHWVSAAASDSDWWAGVTCQQ